MKIKSIDMINFGKFTNYHLDFESGFNLIYGLNESGKSTIHAFIAFVLFGVNKQNTKRKTKIKDYLKFKPLNKNEYNGKLTFEKDGATYEIYRDFINDTYYVSKNGFDITESIRSEAAKDNKSVGEIILGFTRNVFLTSSYISQSKDIYFDDFDDIKDLLFKLKSNDEDDYNLNDAASNVASELAYIGTDNAKTKELYRIKNEINSLDRDISNIENSAEDTMSILNGKELLQKRKNELENSQKEFKEYNADAKIYYKKENLKKIAELDKKKATFKEDKISINKEDYNKYIDIKSDIESMDTKIKALRKYKIFSYIFLIASVLLGMYFNLTKESVISYILITFAIASFITLLALYKKQRRMSKLTEEATDTKKKILAKYCINTQTDFEKAYSDIESQEISKKYLSSLDDLIKTYSNEDFENLSDEKVIAYLSKADHNAYERFKNYSNKANNDAINDLDIKLKEIETKLVYNDKLIRRAYELELRRQGLEDRQSELERRRRALKSAHEILIGLINDINTSYMPKIIKEANKYIEMFSASKYKFFLLDDKFQVMLKNNMTEVVYEEDNLSRQVLSMSYLSLRLALIDVLAIDLPLIFDENFAYFDNERLAIAVKTLHDLRDKKQVLLFTSSKDEKSVLSELNLCYNYIQL